VLLSCLKPPARGGLLASRRIALDCDVLAVAGDDLRITAYTAEPGSEDAEKLDLAIVLGTQVPTR
jgi:hypothetical protein